MDIKELAMFAMSALKTAETHKDALQAIVGRIGKAAGGATEAELNTALDEAIKGRRAAGAAMQEAGKFRPKPDA